MTDSDISEASYGEEDIIDGENGEISQEQLSEHNSTLTNATPAPGDTTDTTDFNVSYFCSNIG